MTRKFSKVFIIASITAVCILVFQTYWVVNLYKTAQRNLKNNIEASLQKSVENYQLKQLESLPTLRNDDLSLYYVVNKKYTDIPKHDSMKDVKYQATMERVTVPKKKTLEIQNLLSLLMSSELNKPINLKDLKPIFEKELYKNDIDMPFDLAVSKHQNLQKGTFYTAALHSKDTLYVKATFKNIDIYLLKRNFVPLLVSLVLIALSAGSLYFMAVTIRKLLKLDVLKNDFINNMTHELRTPISILKSSNEALLNFNAINDPNRAERYLKNNINILNKLNENVDRILDISQYSEGSSAVKFETIDLNDLITSIIERFSVDDNINIQYINQLKNNNFSTDSFIMDTILSNLLDNAVKYSDETVQIHLKISSVEKGIQILIEDHGKGIDSAYLPYIFDKFFRVPNGNIHDVKGYGLGLNYVKQLVEALNGEITVKSKLNTGTTFIVQIPEKK